MEFVDSFGSYFNAIGMLKLAVDFDNVLADTTGTWIKYYNKMHSKSLNKSDIREYYFWDALKISKGEAFKIFSMVWSNWLDLPPLETCSASVLKELAKTSQIDVVTSAISSVGNAKGNIEGWLHKWNFDLNKIVYTTEKGELDYDIFIDDSPYAAVDVAQNSKICLLYDQPWNRTLEFRNVIRIYNLFEVESVVNNMTNVKTYNKRLDFPC